MTEVISLGFPDVGQQTLGHGGQRDAATPRKQETGQSGIIVKPWPQTLSPKGIGADIKVIKDLTF